jgi:outer membrane protein
MRSFIGTLTLVIAAIGAGAQQPAAGPILTLEDAVRLALRYNPDFQLRSSARARAGSELRSAYGALLPQANSSFGVGFRKGGNDLAFGVTLGSTSDQLSSSYSIGLQASLSGSALLAPRQSRANLDAAEADLRNSEQDVRFRVVQQYLTVLQAQARAALQDTLKLNAETQLALNRAKQQVGTATALEVLRAEVQLGQVEVALLRERNNAEIELLRLFQIIGVDKPEGVRLVTAFPVVEPQLDLSELLEMARRANPALEAARSRENAAGVGVAAARSRWLPTLGISTNFSGYTQKVTDLTPTLLQAEAQALAARRSCYTQDSIRLGAGLQPLGGCDRYLFTDADRAALVARNSRYPFDFTNSPFNYSVGLSFPIFDGFRREQQIQSAQLARNDARYQRRALELQLVTEVTSGYQNLMTAYRTVKLQEQNERAARQALQLAEERYRVGAATFVEVTQARADYERAGTDLINAIYDFHKAFAALERAVGRPLR